MIVLADDDGRGLADPYYLAAEIWRYQRRSPQWVEKTLLALTTKMHNLRLYEVGGCRYYAFLKWREYQLIRKDLYQPSKIPPPPSPLSSGGVTPSVQDCNGTAPQDSATKCSEVKVQGKQGKSNDRLKDSTVIGSAPASAGAEAWPAREASHHHRKSLKGIDRETLASLQNSLGGIKPLKAYLLEHGYEVQEIQELRL